MVCSSPLPELLSHESLLWDHREISRRSVLPLHTQSSHRQRCLPCPHPLATRVGLPFRNSLQQAHLCTIFNLLDPTYPQVVCLLAGSAPAMIHAFATSQITGFSRWPTVLTSVAQSPLGQGRQSHTTPPNSRGRAPCLFIFRLCRCLSSSPSLPPVALIIKPQQ